jgi:PKD repeat protein
MHTFQDSVLLHKWVYSFFFSPITIQNFNKGWDKFHRKIQPGIFTKSAGFPSVCGKKAVTPNPRIILLLIILLMVSGIIIPGVCAAGPLVVDFNAVPQFGARPLGVQFNDTTTSADPANNTYLWKFGDGGTSTLKNPRHTYTTSGTFTVNLTVREITGNKATLSKLFYIHVADTANASDFSGAPQCGFSPLPVQFIDGTTIVHDTWQWDFGDGGASNVSDPLYTYNGQGSWNVSLFISNSSGGPQSLTSKSDYIHVIPVADTSFSASGTRHNTSLTVQFNDTSTGFVSPVMYFWDFGDGTTATEQNPSHTYTDPTLSYLVSFTVTGYCGQTMTLLGYISASGGSLVLQPTSVPLAPVADFTGAPLSGATPLDVTFADLSANAPTSWSWLFGDGNSSTLRNPVHTYANPGNYTVSLTAFNSVGSSSKTRNEYITVSGYLLSPPSGPIVNFTGTPTYGSDPLFVQFTDASAGFKDPVTYLWAFGDGSISSVRNASHTYTTSGLHSVSLTVIGSDGYAETLVKPGYITIELPTLELILVEEPQDTSLPSSSPVPTTQPTLQARSPSIVKSLLQAQSLPMVQSESPGIPGYDSQVTPMDITPQNGLSADVVSQGPTVNWLLDHVGENTKLDAFSMIVHSSVTWKVQVYDALDNSKPAPAGYMAEYDTGTKHYIGTRTLQHPLQLQSVNEDNIPWSITYQELSGSSSKKTIQTGPPMVDPSERFKYKINLKQQREMTDSASGPNRGFHVTITFEASPNV